MKRIIISLALLGTLIGGCKKSYFDVNDNPNAPTGASIPPQLILPAAMTRTASIVSTANNSAASAAIASVGGWMGYWAIATNYGAVSETKYDMSSAFADGTWTTTYDIIYDYHTVQQKAEANEQDFYAGIARIMKSLHYGILVDLFNNVPYSKAMDIAGNITPAFDKGEDIYPDLLDQITEGIELIKGADVSRNTAIASSDIMFHGNKTSWAKFGNTLKLRLLIHMSQVPGFNPAAEIAKISAEGSGYLNAGENAAVNPGYTADKPNPFWASYAFDQAGNFPNNYRRANNFALNLMKNLNDERYKYFYRPVRSGSFAGQWRGVDYGTNNDPISTYYEANLSDIGGAPTAAGGSSGLAKSPTMDAWVLTAFESLFLQAEAVTRGWIAGDAKLLYEEGVRESFRWLGVPSADATANVYLASADSRIAWPAAAADQIKVIIWQKYFAFNGNNVIEAWNDYRRTGVVAPAISIDPGRLASHVPTRFPYTATEINYNGAAVQAQGTINALTSTVFWDR